MSSVLKLLLIILIVALITNITLDKIYQPSPQISFGVTFSPKYAQYLKLDWQKTYLSILKDLKVKKLRLPTYWDSIENLSDKDNFEEVDFMLSHASEVGAKVILVLGEKQPRWPECHTPAWVKYLDLNTRREKLLDFMTKVVLRYKDYPEISAWQIENEPFLKSFGDFCDTGDEAFLQTEINAVRDLSNKPIIMTDSGELGNWIVPMKLSDIFGTTVYRSVYSPLFGYFNYPLPAYFYALKSALVQHLFAKNNHQTIIAELQTEPWFASDLFNTPASEQIKLFSVTNLKDNINYAKETGFDEVYLWGVEWWYWISKMGYSQYLDFAKRLF